MEKESGLAVPPARLRCRWFLRLVRSAVRSDPASTLPVSFRSRAALVGCTAAYYSFVCFFPRVVSVRGCVWQSEWKKSLRWLSRMRSANIRPPEPAYSTAISACMHTDDCETAMHIFADMQAAAIAPSDRSCAELILVCTRCVARSQHPARPVAVSLSACPEAEWFAPARGTARTPRRAQHSAQPVPYSVRSGL